MGIPRLYLGEIVDVKVVGDPNLLSRNDSSCNYVGRLIAEDPEFIMLFPYVSYRPESSRASWQAYHTSGFPTSSAEAYEMLEDIGDDRLTGIIAMIGKVIRSDEFELTDVMEGVIETAKVITKQLISGFDLYTPIVDDDDDDIGNV